MPARRCALYCGTESWNDVSHLGEPAERFILPVRRIPLCGTEGGQAGVFMKMKALISFLVIHLSIVLLSCSTSHTIDRQITSTQREANIAQLQSAIDAILEDTLLALCFIGVKIVSLDDDQVLYAKNSNKLFHPASNMKLLTSATALNLLDKGFQFRTSVYADPEIDHGVLKGNVYIKGSGDPLLITNDLDSLARSIASYGINTIAGDLVGDVSYFDTLYWGSGWMWDDEPEPYEAFISPLTVNSNAIQVSVVPGKKIGNTVDVFLNPSIQSFTINNQGITSLDTLMPELTVTRIRGENTITVRGRVPPKSDTVKSILSVWKPELYFLELFKQKLIEHGITVKGGIRLGSTEGLQFLGSISHPLDSVLHQINKPSDNLAAENTLKTIAAELQGSPGTAAMGLSIMKEYLTRIGIDTAKMILADGSGVSFYNAISPDAIIQLLQEQYWNKHTFQRFLESLPIAGIDGTLNNRMKDARTAGNVRAKTGTITGVSTLSGYAWTADAKPLAFNIMCNHFPSQIMHLRNMQDTIMALLVNLRLEEKEGF
ncbi:MAG: D-alanyl-D-alanine carboxypeptidase/D-alanyl-D-alanine-endopeptidase [Ignavibacteriae bacterium]|nr:D-alanyl-D-alanine carboxypeptidase/D-alanyl-D-alanine-endopeptidase [Ignavibacteriota bacterium]